LEERLEICQKVRKNLKDEEKRHKKTKEWSQNSIKERNVIISTLEKDKDLLDLELAEFQKLKQDFDASEKTGFASQDISHIHPKNRLLHPPSDPNISDSGFDMPHPFPSPSPLPPSPLPPSSLPPTNPTNLANPANPQHATLEYSIADQTQSILDRNHNLSSQILSLTDQNHFLQISLGLSEKHSKTLQKNKLSNQKYITQLLSTNSKFSTQLQKSTSNRQNPEFPANIRISLDDFLLENAKLLTKISDFTDENLVGVLDSDFGQAFEEIDMFEGRVLTGGSPGGSVGGRGRGMGMGRGGWVIDPKRWERFSKNVSGELKMVYCKFVDYATGRETGDLSEVERGLNVSMQMVVDFGEYVGDCMVRRGVGG
jgi:hypothetical protein